ncbi:metallopeptidase [Bacteroidales bacterium]|nr:metallopeptidase [Bacteroidales bacterium]
METTLIRAFQLILSLSILVIVHEFGHFFFARIFKVRVEKFYLFFNPWFTLFKFKPKNSDTEYGLGWLPLGGYVKISGMIDESMDKEAMAQEPKEWEFRAKPAWQRLLIMIGGVMMNFLLAFFIYSMILFHWGNEYLPLRNISMGLSYGETAQKAGFQIGDIPIAADGTELNEMNGDALMAIAGAKHVTVLRNGSEHNINLPDDFKNIVFEKDPENFRIRSPFVVSELMADSPASEAGLQVGDSIVGIGENYTLDFTEISKILNANKGENISLNFYRDGQVISQNISTTEEGKLGVFVKNPLEIYQTVSVKYGFFESIPAGIKLGISTIESYLGQFKFIFSKQGAQSLGGFGTIGTLFPTSWNWEIFWTRTAFLSIILGVMNLLPIPALDGGHVMFLLYELVARRKPNEKFMEYAQMGGMIFLIALLLFANGNDLVRFIFK